MIRKLSAATLAVLLALPVLLTYLSADSESSLPPCCRRNGAHHCAMAMRARAAETGPAFRAPLARCPYQTQSITVSAAGQAASDRRFTVSLSVNAFLPAYEPVGRPTAQLSRSSGRGPPALSV